MSFLNVLKRTTILSAAGILALGSTQAQAQNDTSALGHVSVSVVETLEVVETHPIKFGNIAFTGATGCAAGPCVGDVTLTLSNDGARSLAGANTDGMTLLVGIDSDGAGGDAAGANDTPVAPDVSGTGAQSPGFYSITNGDGITNIYVSFSNGDGAIMDSNHPNNYVSLNGPGGQNDEFRVRNFTWEMDTAAAPGPSTSGYVGTAFSTDGYGNYVACAASCNIRVGADLVTVAAAPAPNPGAFQGEFYLMVSY